MKSNNTARLSIRLGLALAVALVLWTPLQSSAAEKMMMDGKMMENCQKMMKRQHKMHAEVKEQDAKLTAEVAALKSAPDDKKLALLTALVASDIEKRVATNARMGQMHDEMMSHMMQHMQMGKESMAECPMMKGMKGKKGLDDAAEDAHKGHHEEKEKN